MSKPPSVSTPALKVETSDSPMDTSGEASMLPAASHMTERTPEDAKAYLASPIGQIFFFKAACHARPVGAHRYFHVLSMQQRIASETGELLPIQSIWDKLEECYNLQDLELREPPNFPTESPPPSPQHARERAGDRDFALEPDWASPGTINLRVDPFFTEDFQLPAQAYDEVHRRVLRGPDDPPSPTDSTGPPSPRKGKGAARSSGPQKKRGKAATNAGRRGTASMEPEGESSLSEMEDDAASAATGTGTAGSEAEEEEAGEEEEEDEEESATPANRRVRGGKPKRGTPSGRAKPVGKRRKSTATK